MPLGRGDLFAGYTIVRLLGSGAMGEVYLVKHPRLPRQDALRILSARVSADTEVRDRFDREADLAATLWHPSVVGVHDRVAKRPRIKAYLASPRRLAFNEMGIFRRYPELDA